MSLTRQRHGTFAFLPACTIGRYIRSCQFFYPPKFTDLRIPSTFFYSASPFLSQPLRLTLAKTPLRKRSRTPKKPKNKTKKKQNTIDYLKMFAILPFPILPQLKYNVGTFFKGLFDLSKISLQKKQ